MKIDKLLIRSSNGKKITLTLHGKNFVSRQIFYTSTDSSSGGLPENGESFVANPDIPDPHTLLTIFPNDLNAKITKRVVKQRGKLMKVHIEFPENITKTTEAIIVIVTPKGIVSKSFIIK